MLVEFLTVVTDYEEQRERAITAELSGDSSVPVFHEKDRYAPTVIDMTLVLGWDASSVFFNNQRKACVFAIFEGDVYSRALVIEPEKFKEIFIHATRKQVYKPEFILEERGL